jgi:hypothetical protein
LLAANGEQLTDLELLTFTKYTGRAKAPEKRVDELWCAVGRRGGKSRAMATMAAYYAGLCDYRDKLARGETGVVPPDARHLWRSPDLYIEPLRSPWGLMGHVQETHYGPEGDPMLLVAQGASRDFNPDLPQSVVDRALDRDPLAVEPQQVIPGQAESADGWHGADTAMRSVPIVAMQPSRQFGSALV